MPSESSHCFYWETTSSVAKVYGAYIFISDDRRPNLVLHENDKKASQATLAVKEPILPPFKKDIPPSVMEQLKETEPSRG